MGGGKPGEITFNGLDNINVDLDLSVLEPIVTESTANITSDSGITLSIPEPIQLNTNAELNSNSTINSDSEIRANTQSGIALDVRPLTLDVCMKLEFGKLPPTCVRQPYQHHFGVTLFGMEVLGFNLVGESRTIIEDVQPQPHIVGTGEQSVRHHHGGKRNAHAERDGGGLRIRID